MPGGALLCQSVVNTFTVFKIAKGFGPAAGHVGVTEGDPLSSLGTEAFRGRHNSRVAPCKAL